MAYLPLKDFVISKGYYILQFGNESEEWIVVLAEKDRTLELVSKLENFEQVLQSDHYSNEDPIKMAENVTMVTQIIGKDYSSNHKECDFQLHYVAVQKSGSKDYFSSRLLRRYYVNLKRGHDETQTIMITNKRDSNQLGYQASEMNKCK